MCPARLPLVAALSLVLTLTVTLAAIDEPEVALNSALVSSSSGDGTTVCEFYNQTCVDEAHGIAASVGKDADLSLCRGNQTCPLSSAHNCYAVWADPTLPLDRESAKPGSRHVHDSGLHVKMMGCFQRTEDCQKRDYCHDKSSPEDTERTGHLFCCCRGSMCNANFKWTPKLETIENPSEKEGENPVEKNGGGSSTPKWIIYILVSLGILALIICLAVCYVVRQRKAAGGVSLDGDDPLRQHLGRLEAQPSPELTRKEITLGEIIAQGRFGAVWRGRMDDELVAVKIFATRDKQSWYAEQEIYNLPRMRHENVLEFMGVDKKGEGLTQEFYLMSKFHEKGSLCDFLKQNTVTWTELCKIAYSMSCGLAHLHEELPHMGTLDMKPAVAHRDFKSKNVLIKNDMTACIGDFGLALIFEPGKSCGDTHGQVGTRRYMAPEVLEGAINFSRDSFLRIDMYACGLVLWELASRCNHLQDASITSAAVPITPQEYKLPFEKEILHPSLEQMQELVVNKKARPAVPDLWTSVPAHPGMGDLISTMRDCWDQDAEARLSASNVKERVKAMREQRRGDGGSSDVGGGPGLNGGNGLPPYSENGHVEHHELQPLIVSNGSASPILSASEVS